MGNHQFFRIEILWTESKKLSKLRIALLLLLRTHLLAVYTLYLTQLLRFECFQHIAAIILHRIDQHTVLMLMVVVRRQCVTVAMIAMTMPNYDRWLCVAAHFRLAQLDFIAHLRTQIHKWKHFPNSKIHMKCNSSQFHFFFLFNLPDSRHSFIKCFFSFFFICSFKLSTHSHTHTYHTLSNTHRQQAFFPVGVALFNFFFQCDDFRLFHFGIAFAWNWWDGCFASIARVRIVDLHSEWNII